MQGGKHEGWRKSSRGAPDIINDRSLTVKSAPEGGDFMRGVNLNNPGIKNSLKRIKQLVPPKRHRFLVKQCISETEVSLAIAWLQGLVRGPLFLDFKSLLCMRSCEL